MLIQILSQYTSALANPRMKFAILLFLEQELEVKGVSEATDTDPA